MHVDFGIIGLIHSSVSSQKHRRMLQLFKQTRIFLFGFVFIAEGSLSLLGLNQKYICPLVLYFHPVPILP